MGQVDWHDFSVDFDGVAVEKAPPIQILSADNHSLFITPVPQDCQVQRLAEFQKERGIEFGVLLFAFEFKNESLIYIKVAACSHMFCVESVLKEAYGHRNGLIISWVNEVDESLSIDHSTGEVAFVCIQLVDSLKR